MSGAPGSEVLNEVGRVQDAGEFNSQGDPHREQSEPVVDCTTMFDKR